MTTANTAGVPNTTDAPGSYRLPDPPPRHDDEVTSHRQLTDTGHAHHLAQHLGNPETTLVTAADYWIAPHPHADRRRLRRPDLLVAFGVDPARYVADNGYIVSEQGKPPDFVLEVASASTAQIDTGDKRVEYAALGILEYWRFDETGEYHGARLAGDRLVDGRYEPIEIEPVAEGILQGYSAALNLYLRWERGRLGWYDPATGRHIATFDSERERADLAEIRADRERERADRERDTRIQTEARIRELEQEILRLQSS